jgi:glycosyltransferase involved in cell wall biosynthesis
MNLTVVIPVYNERNTIEEILDRVARVNIEKEVVVVDDGSTDGTREILQKLYEESEAAQGRNGNIRVIFHERNCGKGAALRRGFARPVVRS